MKNLFTVSQAIEMGLKLENLHDYKAMLALCDEVNLFYPCELLVATSLEDGTHYLQNVYVYLKGTKVCVRTDYDKSKYSFNCYEYFKDLSGSQMYEFTKHIVRPNKVGKLTTKKITEWVNYYNEYLSVLTAMCIELNNNVYTFLESIKNENVRYWNNNKCGSITKNGINFEFSIYNGVIDKKITLAYVGSEFETFLKLSDNKFVASELI